MRGVKVNVVLYRCIRKIKIEILPCGKAHCRPSAVSEGLPSGFLICWYDVGPRHRDGLPAVTGCLHPWLFLLSRAGWNPAGSKKDVAPRHLDLAPLGNRVPRRWIRCSPYPNPYPVSSGRRRWHGISRASASTSSPQAVAESGRYCLPRRCLIIRHDTRERAGDNEEHRDEVMAVSTTPVQYEKQGHDVSGGYTPERTFCPIKHIRLNRRTRKHLGDKAQRPWQWCDRSQESRSLSAIVIPG